MCGCHSPPAPTPQAPPPSTTRQRPPCEARSPLLALPNVLRLLRNATRRSSKVSARKAPSAMSSSTVLGEGPGWPEGVDAATGGRQAGLRSGGAPRAVPVRRAGTSDSGSESGAGVGAAQRGESAPSAVPAGPDVDDLLVERGAGHGHPRVRPHEGHRPPGHHIQRHAQRPVKRRRGNCGGKTEKMNEKSGAKTLTSGGHC